MTSYQPGPSRLRAPVGRHCHHPLGPPTEAAVARLVGAVQADVRDEWRSRRYLSFSEASMALLRPTGDTGSIVAIDSGQWAPFGGSSSALGSRMCRLVHRRESSWFAR